MRYYFKKVTKEALPWPQAKRMGIIEFIGGITFGGLFFTPFIYGQYSYKTRSGLSAINFTQSTDYQDLFDPSVETTTNYAEMLQSDVKPGDHY